MSAGGLLVCCVLMIGGMLSGSGKTGARWLFESKSFHYQAQRALSQSSYQGAEPGEVLSVINHIRDQDEEGWHVNWYQMAGRVETMGDRSADDLSTVNAIPQGVELLSYQ